MRRRYTVYRMHHRTGNREAIGCIEERRRGERNTQRNYRSLLAEAREIFGEGPDEGIDIALNHRNEAERPEGTGDEEGKTGKGSEDHGSDYG